MPSSYYPHAAIPGLPTVIGVNAIGAGMTASNGTTQKPVFANSSGEFFDSNGKANVATIAATCDKASAADNSVGNFFSNYGGGPAGTFDITTTDGSGFLGGVTQPIAWDATGDFQVTNLLVTGMPTSDPHSAGQLWSNLGIVTISAG